MHVTQRLVGQQAIGRGHGCGGGRGPGRPPGAQALDTAARLLSCVTPMLEGLVLLSIAIGLRGVGQGLNLPLMISIASRAVAPTLQGRVAALRISFNRLGAALFPIGMGALAEVIGLEASFYIIGLLGLCLISALGVWVSRAKNKISVS